MPEMQPEATTLLQMSAMLLEELFTAEKTQLGGIQLRHVSF